MARNKFAPWTVVDQLPGGGQGDLFVVTSEGTEGRFALKRLRNPDRSDRFVREVETMQALADSGVPVPPVVADGVTKDRDAKPFFVMPFYEAGSLEAAVTDRRFAADIMAGVEMALSVARALAALHACNQAHRDIKPANVLLDEEGKPVLADFGLALSVEEHRAEDRLTSTTEAVGSRLYIAPENESGFNPELEQRPADFYSYGKLVWALLAGRPPPAREQQLEHRFRLATLTGIGALARLDGLLEQLLITDPRGRLVNWGAVEAELLAVLEALGGTPSTTSITFSDAAEAAARRYAGSEAYLGRQKREEETLRRMKHFRDLAQGASEGLDEFTGEFARVSQLAAGMELRRGASGLSLEWPFEAALHGIGRFGEPGWSGIPGSVASAGSSPLAGVEIAEQHDWDRMDPLVSLTLHAYIEDWSVWLLQLAAVYAAPGDIRLPPFLASFRRTDGPFRLGLGAAVDRARDAGRRLGTDSLMMFGRVLDVLAEGGALTDPASWLEPSLPATASDEGDEADSRDIRAIEQLLEEFERGVAGGCADAQDVAFRLASRIARWVDRPLEVRIKSGHERDFDVRMRVAAVRWVAWNQDAEKSPPTLHVFRAYVDARGDVDRRREFIIGRPSHGLEAEFLRDGPTGELALLDEVEMERFAKEARPMWAAIRAEKAR